MAHFSSNCNVSHQSICAKEEDNLDLKYVANLKLKDDSNPKTTSQSDQPPSMEKIEEEEGNKAHQNETEIITNNAGKELRQDISEKRKHFESDKDLDSPELPTTDPKSDLMTIHKEDKDGNPVAFSIPVENGTSTCRQPPKRLCNTKKSRKAGHTSIESLNKKQALAEERRQKQKENKLKRIHERQEDARRLAKNVEILLQQRAVAQGRTTDSAIKRMQPSEILATAHLVSNNFRALTTKLGTDLTVKDNEKERPYRNFDKNQNNRDSCTQNCSSMFFTVSFEDEKSPVRPKIAFKMQQKKKAVVTAEDLEEKQRQAEARRNKRKQDRSRRVRENREALFEMANDIEKFKMLQSASQTKEGDRLEHKKEAAILAEKLASQFDRLNKRYSEDLKRAENFQVCLSHTYFLGSN